MSSQPYVYKPPARRGSQNISAKSQIIPQTTSSSLKPEIKINKISDLGSSSIFKGLDNLSALTTQKKDQSSQKNNITKEESKPLGKDRSVSGQGRFERRQVIESLPINEQVSFTVGKITQTKAPVIESQKTPSVTVQYGRKPVTRNIQEEAKEVERPALMSRKPQVTTNVSQTGKDESQTSQNGLFFKPVIKRTQGTGQSVRTPLISGNNSVLISGTSQKSEQIKQTKNQSEIYPRRGSRESSIVDLNLQVNTQVKIFKLQAKNQPKLSSTQKIPTSKSITSSSQLVSPEKETKTQQKDSQSSVSQNSSMLGAQKSTSIYPRPKTKAQLVRENQLKMNQAQTHAETSQPVQQHKSDYRYQNRSTIKEQTVSKVTKSEQTTLINDKQAKGYSYQFTRKTKEQLVSENKAKTSYPHIVVSAQSSKPQQRKISQQPQKAPQKSTGYVYQPAYRRTQKFTQEGKSQQKQTSYLQEKSVLMSQPSIQIKRSQYSYQRKQVTQQITTETVTVHTHQTITTTPVTYNRAGRVSSYSIPSTSQPSTKTLEGQEEKAPKNIPSVAFTLLSVLIKKKMNSNCKFWFVKMKQNNSKVLKREKNLQLLLKKSVLLGQSYLNYLKLQTFSLFKKCFLIKLNGTQDTTASRITNIRTKTKESKQNQELQNLITNMKKPLCYQLASLFNSKIKAVFKDKIHAPYTQQIYSSKKSPIFLTLIKLFNSKQSSNLKNSFLKIKFSYNYVFKADDDDMLPLFEMRNKKLSKQQIVKYFQNIFPAKSMSTQSSRISLLQKTPEKRLQGRQSLIKSKTQSQRNLVEPSFSAVQIKKLQEFKSNIQNLQKKLKQQEKVINQRQAEINQKKKQLKIQIDEIKKQNEVKKIENEQLKEKLKKYGTITFSDSKVNAVSQQYQQFVSTPTKQPISRQRIPRTGQSSQLLDNLCEIYLRNLLKSQTSFQLWKNQNFETFLSECEQLNPLVVQSLNYILRPEQQSSYPTVKNDKNLIQKLQKSKILIEERILLQENTMLKSQVQLFENQFIGESQPRISISLNKVQEQVEAMKALVANYIKERYLWQWIKKSISKI